MERNKEVLLFNLIFSSLWSTYEVFFIYYLTLIFLVVFAGIFILLKKPNDPTAKLFYFFCVVFATCLHSQHFLSSYMIVASSIQALSYPLFSTLFFHFLTIFPERLDFDKKYYWMRIVMYVGGVFFGVLISGMFLNYMFDQTSQNNLLREIARVAANYWMGISLLFAVSYGFVKYKRLNDTYYKNQFRWIIVGFFFGTLLPMSFGLTQSITEKLFVHIPNLLLYVNGVGTPIMLLLFLFAIMKYKVWNIELIITRGLIYSSVTALIIGIYFLLIFLTESILSTTTIASKIIGISTAALAFIPIREKMQSGVNKLFYREEYDPAAVLYDFENNLLGIYNKEKLFSDIVSELNKIFHFNQCICCIKKTENVFEKKTFLVDTFQNEYVIDDEFSEHLVTAKPFSMRELNNNMIFDSVEFVVLLIDEKVICGFILCGSKLSQLQYTLQDISLLQLLAQRIVSLLKTAEMYNKELERQIIVEKEWARISRDMHDEIGSSLTKISILSELLKRDNISSIRSSAQLEEISLYSRGIISNINEIIWAINPDNDSLDNLVAYVNQYSSKFLEGTEIKFEFCADEILPELKMSSEQRRNLFLVIKESLNNAVKHSGASRISLKFIYKNSLMIISIKDNGKGINCKSDRLGNGMDNMRNA